MRGLGIARAHAEDAAPGIGGLAAVGELLLPDPRDLPRELRACVHVLAAEDLVLVELDERLEVVELHEEPSELVHHRLIGGGEVVQLLQVGGRVDRLDELVATDLRAACEELADERSVEDLGERVGERGLGAARIARVDPERLEHVEREAVDVRDERVAEPGERLLGVVQIAMRERRRAAEEVRAGAATVAGAVAALREGVAERTAEAIAAAELVALTCGGLEDGDRLVARGSGERGLEEAARALGLAARRRDLRRAGERADAIRRRLGAHDLALVEIGDVDRLRRELREALEQRLGLRRRDEDEALLAVRHRVLTGEARACTDLRLADELVSAVGALDLTGEHVVGDGERVLVARLHAELLEVLGEALVGALRADELDRDGDGVGVAADVGEALEGAAERGGALGAVPCVEPPLLQLARDDALPPEAVAELDVRVAHRRFALIGEIGEGAEGLVAAIELVGEDGGELRRELHDLLLVGLDLDPLDEELGDAAPLLGDLTELAEARERVEVLEVRLAHEIERADRVPRILELLVETSEPAGDLSALLHVGDELELALECVGGLAERAAVLLEVRDRLEGRAAGRIEVREDQLVARDRGVDVADAVGEQLGLAERDARLLRLVDRVLTETAKECGGLGVVFTLDGVVDEPLERLAIVAVLEEFEPHLAGELLVLEPVCAERRSLASDDDPLAAIGEAITALREERDELVRGVGLVVPGDEQVRVVVVQRIELGRLLEARECFVLAVRPREVVGGARVAGRLLLEVAGEEPALVGRVRRLLPGLRRRVEAIGLVPELAVAERVRGLGVGVAGEDRFAELLAELAEALHQLPTRDRILDRRCPLREHLRGEVGALALLEQLRGGEGGLVVVRRAMRPHASPAATRSFRLSSWSLASFFSRKTFVSMSDSIVASCSRTLASSSQRWDRSRRRISAVRALSSLRSSDRSCRHAEIAPSTSRRLPSQRPATSRRRSLRVSRSSAVLAEARMLARSTSRS